MGDCQMRANVVLLLHDPDQNFFTKNTRLILPSVTLAFYQMLAALVCQTQAFFAHTNM